MKAVPIVISLIMIVSAVSAESELDSLAGDFWEWRAVYQPLTGDDIPRIERPVNWVPDWSRASIEKQRQALSGFENRWRELEVSGRPVARQVDYRLIGSALARVRWELDLLRGWQRNAVFYIDQTLGAIFNLLLQPSPFDPIRSKQIVQRTANIPAVISDAKKNLDSPIQAFAFLAITGLKDVRERLTQVERELSPLLVEEQRRPFRDAMVQAIAALESYHDWLHEKAPQMPAETAIGREHYLFFLNKVALLPYTPEELLQMGRQEWERAVAFETYEKNRNQTLSPLSLFPNQTAQIERCRQDELKIRKFLQEKDILTIPDWVRHYGNMPLPAYLKPLAHLGVNDDLTSPSRLKENAVNYIPEPNESLGYFYLASAQDPRPILVHEGIPGHYLQMVLSWAQENRIRRHYYDSGPNEGIGFYVEEMLLQAGLFDDSPQTREIIYNFMRLRALRVEVDVKLATGDFTIEQAADYLAQTVPMDANTALEEAAFFASTPGQAITYQIGKLQILQFLSNARRIQRDAFSLRDFHDFLWRNGNVPIALQQWEYLGLD